MNWPRMYLGPAVRGSFLTPGRVFANGYPPPVEDAVRQHPALAELFVSTAEIAKGRAEIQRTGSRLNTVYNQTNKLIHEGGLHV